MGSRYDEIRRAQEEQQRLSIEIQETRLKKVINRHSMRQAEQNHRILNNEQSGLKLIYDSITDIFDSHHQHDKCLQDLDLIVSNPHLKPELACCVTNAMEYQTQKTDVLVTGYDKMLNRLKNDLEKKPFLSVYNALSEKIAKLNAELAPFEAKISQEREAFAQFDHQNQKYNQAKQMKIRSLNTHLSSALEKLQTAKAARGAFKQTEVVEVKSNSKSPPMALNEPAEPSEKAEQIDDDHQDDDSIPSPIKIEISSSQCSVVSDNEPMAKVPSSVAGSSIQSSSTEKSAKSAQNEEIVTKTSSESSASNTDISVLKTSCAPSKQDDQQIASDVAENVVSKAFIEPSAPPPFAPKRKTVNSPYPPAKKPNNGEHDERSSFFAQNPVSQDEFRNDFGRGNESNSKAVAQQLEPAVAQQLEPNVSSEKGAQFDLSKRKTKNIPEYAQRDFKTSVATAKPNTNRSNTNPEPIVNAQPTASTNKPASATDKSDISQFGMMMKNRSEDATNVSFASHYSEDSIDFDDFNMSLDSTRTSNQSVPSKKQTGKDEQSKLDFDFSFDVQNFDNDGPTVGFQVGENGESNDFGGFDMDFGGSDDLGFL